MSDRHVVPVEDGWHVEKDQAQRASAKAPTQAEAIKRAVEIVANDGGGEVIVHGTDGAIRDRRTVAAHADDTTTTAAVTAAESAARGAGATAEAAADEVSDTAGTVGDDAATTGRKIAGETRAGAEKAGAHVEAGADGVRRELAAVADDAKSGTAAARDAAAIAETTAEQVGDQVDRTARQVAGESRAAARRAGAEVDATAARAERELVRGADRAATVGAGVGEELESASDRTGRRIHDVTESAAVPLDHLSERVVHTLNPIRITGRVVGVAVAATLHLAGRASTRGTAAAARGARQVTRN